MSIYLGKDNLTNYVLHMTNKYETEEAMKSGVLDSTTFHSSLPYLQLYASYNVPVIRTLTFSGTSGSMYSFTAPVPNAAIDLILAGYKFIVVLASTNTGSKKLIVNAASRFYTSAGLSPNYNYGTLTYAWGPTANAYSWQEHPASKPSYTNKYILLSDFANHTDPLLYPSTGSGHKYPLDNVIDNTATLYFFNIKHNDLEVINSPRSIYINSDKFLIGTPYGDMDLATSKPFRITSTRTATSFSTRSSNINIQPYQSPTSPISSWIIDGTNSDAGKITKKLANGIIENFISNTSKNMVLINSLTKAYSVTSIHNGSNSVGLGVPVGSDEAVTVLVSGTFSNSITTKTIEGHANFLTNNGILETVVYGRTGRLSNGTWYEDDYQLRFGVVSGALVANVLNSKAFANGGWTGTFTGTVRILKFKIR